MLQGIILKGYSGFYYVHTDTGIVECSLRGHYRIKDQEFLPGDRVEITETSKGKGVIQHVLPRTNRLVRPPVANVDQVVIVAAVTNPEPDLELLDRLLVQAETAYLAVVICWNKVDLISPGEREHLISQYRDLGYRSITASTKKGYGIDDLRSLLAGKVSIFAGPSGVGKSSLLNAVQPGLSLKTGEISSKGLRGKHTTRHVELLPLKSGGLVADSPGFSRLIMPLELRREELAAFFPEMEKLLGACRFSTCLHWQEPQCAVRQAVADGSINSIRYDHYITFLQEIINRERSY